MSNQDPIYYKCSRCGKFCSPKTAEFHTSYGSAWDTEPPDEECTCSKCVEIEIAEAIEARCLLDCYWIKPPWYAKTAKIIGWEYRDGRYQPKLTVKESER